MLSNSLHRIQSPDGQWVLAWGCDCGEVPNRAMAVVELDEPSLGVKYQFNHVDCLAEDQDE